MEPSHATDAIAVAVGHAQPVDAGGDGIAGSERFLKVDSDFGVAADAMQEMGLEHAWYTK